MIPRAKNWISGTVKNLVASGAGLGDVHVANVKMGVCVVQVIFRFRGLGDANHNIKVLKEVAWGTDFQKTTSAERHELRMVVMGGSEDVVMTLLGLLDFVNVFTFAVDTARHLVSEFGENGVYRQSQD